MAFDLAAGVTVRVEHPGPPQIRVAPPSATVLVVPVQGPPGQRGPAGGGDPSAILFQVIAATALSGHRVVTPQPDGRVGYASNTSPTHIHAPLWLTTGAAATGGEVTVLAFGAVTEPSWAWIPGPVYLGVNGLITQVSPSAPAVFLTQVGVATSPTTLFLDRHQSIVLT